mmetsp:Transcript_11882/g.33963  ORF Transcript_11882/g.33963 Transcript_11882/m.33963 type:complete len:745 (-) Transcript_11882:47-2281(-)
MSSRRDEPAAAPICSSAPDPPSQAASAALEDEDTEQLLYREYTSAVHTFLRSVWACLLGASAFVELLSFVVPYLYPPNTDEMSLVERELQPGLLFFLPGIWRGRRYATASDMIEDESRSVSQWLDDNCYPIGVVFNCLWTVHSFVAAARIRRKAQRGLEKRVLLKNKRSGEKVEVEEKADAINATKDVADATDGNSDEAAKPKGKRFYLKNVSEELSMSVYSTFGAWGVYFVLLAWMLLLLPVGFFIRIADETKRYAGVEITMESALDHDALEQLHVITAKTKYCLLYAVFLRVYTIVSMAATEAIMIKKKLLTKRLAKFLGIFAIKHPVAFRRRLRRTLTALRWIKYIFPLIGQGNKLIGQLKNLRKRQKQQKEVEKAKITKRRTWQTLSKEQRQETAAIMLQKDYRGYKKRRAYKAILKVRAEKKRVAAIKIQATLRRRAAEARVRVAQKKKELFELKMRQAQRQYGATGAVVTKLDVEAKRHLYQLEEELGIEFQEMKWRKMMLRPTTNFIIYWRVLFVICVILEITHLALEPRVAQYRDAQTGKKLNVGIVLEHYLVPTPVSEWQQCEALHLDDNFKKRRWRPQRRRIVEKRKETSEQAPWYCRKPYSQIHSTFCEFIRYLVKDLLILISMICFLDCFVVFFTGEICEKTGQLIPKKFFTRWLLPGLTLQVLVNPKMIELNSAIRCLWQGIHHIGPARVWRWTVVLIEPALFAFYNWFVSKFWRRFVVEKNSTPKHVEPL